MDGFWWVLILLGPLLFFQRRLHFETQAVFLLLTRSQEIAVMLFSLLFFPGVLVHETSHFVMARLLGIRTGKFSLLPQVVKGGRVRLGFVETASADVVRDALIGVAPLLVGGAFVAWVGLVHLDFPVLWAAVLSGELATVWVAFGLLVAQPDFWLWFYLVFAVSSTMLPSAADRRAWPALGLVAALILGAALVVGAGPWMAANLAPYFNRAMQAVAAVMGISVMVHLVVLPLAWGLRTVLSRLTRMSVSASG